MVRCSSAVVKRSSSAGKNSVAVSIALPHLEKEAQEELLECWHPQSGVVEVMAVC